MISSERQSYEEAQRRSLLGSIHVAEPVRVVSFNKESMTVDIQPLTRQFNGEGYIDSTQLVNVPVASITGGGFVFRPEYRTGDQGFVVYMDGDMDTALSSGVGSAPNTERMHARDDAIFVGAVNVRPVGFPAEGACLGVADGSVYIAVKASGVEIKGNLKVDGTVTADNI